MPHKKNPVNPAYLFFSKGMRLTGEHFRDCLVHNAGLSDERAQEILDRLADKGVRTYGQLMEFCSRNWLTKEIPGIEPQTVESIQHFVLYGEERNKSLLEAKYYKSQEEIVRLKKQQPVQQLDKATTEGREIAKSM